MPLFGGVMEQQTFVAIAMGCIGALIWFIRLEAKLIYLERDHNKLEETSNKTDLLFQTKVDKLISDINLIQVSLTRIETKLVMSKEPKNG